MREGSPDITTARKKSQKRFSLATHATHAKRSAYDLHVAVHTALRHYTTCICITSITSGDCTQYIVDQRPFGEKKKMERGGTIFRR